MCIEGTRYCRDGAWSGCEDLHTFPPPAAADPTSIVDPDAGLTPCSPCEVGCFLLTDAPLPPWHKATERVRAIVRQAAEHCRANGTDIAKLALQFSIANEDMTTCITGSANPDRVAQWVQWTKEPLDQLLLDEVLRILEPIHNWFYIEGRPENNDEMTVDEPHVSHD